MRHKDFALGNTENPEYVFVFPTLRKSDGKPCGHNTRVDIQNATNYISDANSCFVSWILSPMSEDDIRADDIKRDHGDFVEFLLAVKPKYIVTFGNKLPKKLLNWGAGDSLQKNHGSYFRWFDSYVIPMFGAKMRSMAEYEYYYQNDLANRLMLAVDSIPKQDFIVYADNNDFIKYLENVNTGRVYLDIESTGLDAYTDKILLIGFSFDGSEKVHVVTQPDDTFVRMLLGVIKRRKLLVVGHNIKFDMKFLCVKGTVIDLNNTESNTAILKHMVGLDDTMTMAHYLGNHSLSLKHLTTMHLKRLGNNAFKGDLGYATIEYLVEDVITTKQLYHKFLAELSNELLIWQREMNITLLLMELNRMYIDKDRLKMFQHDLTQEIEEQKKKLVEMSNNPDFNPNSNPQIADALLSMGVRLKERTENGQLKTDKAVLNQIDNEFTRTLTGYKESTRMLNTYVVPYLSLGNTIGCEFLTTGAFTGRLASRDVNLQNVPNKLGFKQIFVSRFIDGLFALADNSQAELRVAAYLSGDVKFAKALASEDAHSVIASYIFDKPIDKKTPEGKHLREVSKRTGFGLLYGGQPYGLSAQMRAAGLDVSMEMVEHAYNAFFKQFPVLGKWINAVQETVEKQGYIMSPLGHKLDYRFKIADGQIKAVKREAVNAPIQGTSAMLLGFIMNEVRKQMVYRNMVSVLINTVHDSQAGDVHPSEKDEYAHVLQLGFESLNNVNWVRHNKVYKYLPFTGDLVFGKSWFDCEGKESGSTSIESYPLYSHKV